MDPKQHSKQFLADIVAKSPDLSRFIQKIEQLSKLNQAIKTHLDPMLARQCQVANLRNGMLILTTTSSIWGHQLRFQEMELLSHLRTHPEWCGLTSVQSKVVPAMPTLRASKFEYTGFSKPYLSIISAHTLKQTAETIIHPRLQAALLRLATHAVNHRI
jgi:hypothetical protein